MSESTGATPATEALTVDQAADQFRGLLGGDTPATEEPTDSGEAEADAETEATNTGDGEPSDGETESQEPEGEAETEEAPPEPKKYKVKAAGEELEVDESELIKGYQREADYRKKTAEIADRARETAQLRDQFRSALDNIIPQLQQQLQGEFQNINWTQLAQEDPAQYIALRARYDERVANLSQAQAQQAELARQQQSEHKKQYAEYLANEQAELARKLPVFADREKGNKARQDVASYLKAIGFSDSDIAGIADHRAVSVAYEAMMWRESQKKAKGEAAKKVAGAPPVLKPSKGASSAKPNMAAEAAARLQKSGKLEDAAAIFKGMKLFG